MTRSGKFTVLILFLFLSSFLGIAWVQVRLSEQLRKSINDDQYQALWGYVSLNVEYHRLAHALARGIYQAEDFNREDLQLRYDIFVSRISQLKIGVYAELLRDDPGYRQILTGLHGFVAEADRYLGAGLARVELDRAALRRLQARFAELRDPLNDQLLLANQRNGAMLDLQRAQVREQVIFNMVLTAMQSLLALVLALAVLRETRRRAQSHAALLAAQATTVENLRRHESELEQRIAERTVELEQANQQLAALSMTDGLTGLANRRRFDAALTAEWRRAERVCQPLALALLDVDWFKHYNDHYGHLAGDDCLRRIARLLEGHMQRGGDLVARYGGEEFVFIAPVTDGQTALNLAEALCRALEALALPHATSPLGHVTVSIGVAALVPDGESRPEGLIAQADRALYQAKAQGRNCVRLAQA